MKWFYGLYPTDRVKIKNIYHYISDFFPDIKIMFSIWPIVSRCKSFYREFKKHSFRNVFSIKDETEIILDSGSFSYYRAKRNLNIQLDLNKILEIYELINPNFAVHNDIPVSFLRNHNPVELIKLKKKNIKNAREFLKQTKNFEFEPIGVAQGITDFDYSEQVLKLYQMGYTYIGIGGIAFLGKKRITSILDSIFLTIEEEKLKIKIHIFGVGRLNILKEYPINSFDNTTPLNDSHRDRLGKWTYYYIYNEKNRKFEKKSLFNLQKQNYKIACQCPLCKMLSREILLMGSALRNHSRAFHNSFIYQKNLDVINSQNCINN